MTTRSERCFQLMETDGEARLASWMANWRDLVDFLVVPVVAMADFYRLA